MTIKIFAVAMFAYFFLQVLVLIHGKRWDLLNTPMVILQDGGELCDQPLSELPNEVWQDFQKSFLN
jgi:hypothetical protein